MIISQVSYRTNGPLVIIIIISTDENLKNGEENLHVHDDFSHALLLRMCITSCFITKTSP